jgi:hypothetical protein
MENKKIKLPYGVSNFKRLIRDGYYYIDKTRYIEQLEDNPEPYIFFLRPRRFGKSLLVSQLRHYYGLEYIKINLKTFLATITLAKNQRRMQNI